MTKAMEIAADAALETLRATYAVNRRDVMLAAVAENPKVLADLGKLIGSLDRDTLAAMIAE